MKRLAAATGLMTLAAVVVWAAWKTPPAPSVPALALRPTVTFLADDARAGRLVGSPGEQASAHFIEQAFEQLALPPPRGSTRRQPFVIPLDGGGVKSAGNVLAFLDVGAPTTLLIGAHYDHLGLGPAHSRDPFTPGIHNGADDNASGVAVLLTLASRLAAAHEGLRFNVLFAAWSGEEEGLYGSKAFASSGLLESTHVFAVLNYDMVGRLDPTEPRVTLEGQKEFPQWNAVLAPLKPKGFSLRTSEGIAPGSSDHCTFAALGVPVLSLSTGESRDYHLPSDDVDKLDFAGMENLVELTLSLVDALSLTDSFSAAGQRGAPPAH